MVKGIMYITFLNQKVRVTYRIIDFKVFSFNLENKKKNGGKSSKFTKIWRENPQKTLLVYTFDVNKSVHSPCSKLKKGIVMSENKLDLCHVCCCCWEKFGVNSKALRNVNSTVDDLMKLYIFPGFSTDVEDYPTTICSNCHRNLFFLKSGKSSRHCFFLLK